MVVDKKGYGWISTQGAIGYSLLIYYKKREGNLTKDSLLHYETLFLVCKDSNLSDDSWVI